MWKTGLEGRHKLEKEIERLYLCSNISQILEVTKYKAYETFLNRSMSESDRFLL